MSSSSFVGSYGYESPDERLVSFGLSACMNVALFAIEGFLSNNEGSRSLVSMSLISPLSF